MIRLVLRILFGLALGALPVALFVLETVDRGLRTDAIEIGETPATLMRRDDAADRPLAVIAHGFAGSRQMMHAIQLTLARAGFAALAFDFIGHGRHPGALDPRVTDVTGGTTAGLVTQTEAVVAAALELDGVTGPSVLVGHSMATDVIVRVAAARETGPVVAISMYSTAVTETHPEALLIVSGQWEGRLREVALAEVAKVEAVAEGETAVSGTVFRRANVAPWVGHVGVLWSPATQRAIRDWTAPGGSLLGATGPWILIVLAAIPILTIGSMPRAARPAPAIHGARVVRAVAAPVLPATAVAVLFAPGALGLVGFGSLAAFLGVWGIVALLVTRPLPRQPGRATLLAAFGMAAFALALDRYGASFWAGDGPRLALWGLLALGAVPFALADAALVQGAGIGRRLAVRAVPLAALAVAAFAEPARLGLLFTVLPVTVLFWIVFGTMARPAIRADGPVAPGIVTGVALAWALAASTPMFATS